MNSRRTGRASRAVAGLISFLVLAGLTGGLPAVLFAAGGQPVPRAVPSWHQLLLAVSRPDDGTLALTAIRTVTWLAWAAFTLCAAREAASALRGNRARPILGLAPLQGLAAILISAILAAAGGPEAAQATPLRPPASAGPLRARPAGALQADGQVRHAENLRDIALSLRACQAGGAHRTPCAPSSAPPPAWSSGGPPLGSSRPGAAATRTARPARPRTYRVRPGDNLWDIAARYLGSSDRWPELYWLNAGRPQPGGGALSDPNLIYPGWVLHLTPPRTDSSGQHAPGSAPHPYCQHASEPASALPGPAGPRRDHQATRPHHDQATPARRTAVSLPGGGLVSYSVALMATAALTLAALQRRRRYKPGTNPDPVIRPAVRPPPAVIRALRHAARSVPPTAGPVTGAGFRADPYPDPYGDDTDPAGAATPAPAPPGSSPASGSLPVPPGRRDDPDQAGPAQQETGIRLGMRGTSEAVIDIAAVGGIGLTGPGAPGAARAALTALLAQPRAQFPSVIIPAALASLLVPGHGPIPGVSVAATASHALDELETAVLRQARTAAEPSQAAALERGVVLIAASDPAITRRLAGTLAAGRAQQAAAIVLGPWEPGVTCHANADGIITAATPATPSLDGVRLFTLSADEARAIADLLRDADGPPSAVASGRRLPEPGPVRSAAQLPAPVPSRPGAASGATPYALQPAAPSPAGPRAGSADKDGDRPDRPVRITVLGPPRVTAAGKDISGGLRKARELLAYLATFPGGASDDAISEALWPGSSSPTATTSHRNLALRKARGQLRAATGMTAPAWIIRTADRYRLDPAMISADLWDFSAALDQARQATDPAARLTALRKAVALYQGDLAEGEGYDWAEPYAETARRRALDAWTAIAGILQPDNPAQALDALETALGHDPYNEHLYQQIMQLQARAGHPEAVRRTLSLLESRLTELGVTPVAQTRQLAAGLLGTAPQHRAESKTQSAARPANA